MNLLPLMLFLGAPQFAPPPLMMPADPRIQLISYSSDRVVDLRVVNGFAAIIELAADERVETVVVGNTAGWEVTPNRSGNRVMVKPLASAKDTNLIIVTDQRRYVFMINADSEGGSLGAFVVRFSYPEGHAGNVQRVIRAADYKLRGNKTLYPLAMSDDGQRTVITWDKQTSLPAIFAIDERGHEALVNGRMVDGDYVIQGTAKRYVFRLGKVNASAARMPLKVRP
jgi:type IV secretion system protein VirB9